MDLLNIRNIRFITFKTLIIFIISLLCTQVKAAPIYFTFEGVIENITVTSQGGSEDIYKPEIIEYANNNGLGIGNSVSYTIMVDQGIAGTVYSQEFDDLFTYNHHYDGYDSYGNGLSYDYYYAELIDGNVLGGGSKEYNYVNSLTRYNPSTLEPVANHPYTSFKLNSFIEIHNASTTNNLFDDLFVGEEFLFTNTYDAEINTSYHFGYLHGSLTLSNISSTPISPVPIPPSLFLFVPALVGFRVMGFIR